MWPHKLVQSRKYLEIEPVSLVVVFAHFYPDTGNLNNVHSKEAIFRQNPA